MTGAPRCEAGVRTDELLALIAQYAVNEGPTRSGWPGLTFYRFGQRVAPHWDEVGSPSLYLVAKARQRIRMGSVNYFDDPFHVLVMTLPFPLIRPRGAIRTGDRGLRGHEAGGSPTILHRVRTAHARCVLRRCLTSRSSERCSGFYWCWSRMRSAGYWHPCPCVRSSIGCSSLSSACGS